MVKCLPFLELEFYICIKPNISVCKYADMWNLCGLWLIFTFEPCLNEPTPSQLCEFKDPNLKKRTDVVFSFVSKLSISVCA